jgi:AcrR family transcriptional regulator
MTTQPLKRRRAPRGSGDQLREEILDATTDLLLETGHGSDGHRLGVPGLE